MSTYLKTTTIPTMKTIGEIQIFLTDAGADAIQIENDSTTREPKAMSFLYEVNGRKIPFRLPARVEPVYEKLHRERSIRTRSKYEEQDYEQARRVAWRQILYWVKAQFALIDTGMVEAAEVFLPYAQVGIDETFYQKLKAGKFKALPEVVG